MDTEPQFYCHDKLCWLEVKSQSPDWWGYQPSPSIWETKRLQLCFLPHIIVANLVSKALQVLGVNALAQHLLSEPPNCLH